MFTDRRYVAVGSEETVLSKRAAVLQSIPQRVLCGVAFCNAESRSSVAVAASLSDEGTVTAAVVTTAGVATRNSHFSIQRMPRYVCNRLVTKWTDCSPLALSVRLSFWWWPPTPNRSTVIRLTEVCGALQSVHCRFFAHAASLVSRLGGMSVGSTMPCS